MRGLSQISLSRRRPIFAVVAVIFMGCLTVAASLFFAPYREFDILIVNGTVIDGTGAPAHVCDVAICDHKIVGLSRGSFSFHEQN